MPPVGYESVRILVDLVPVTLFCLDQNEAFDCLLCYLPFYKLKAYGLSTNYCYLITRYMNKRKQHAKISNLLSYW